MLTAEDKKHLEAARAWLDLSGANYPEANEELELIEARNRSHPHVLTVRIAIYLCAGKREEAAIIADALGAALESG